MKDAFFLSSRSAVGTDSNSIVGNHFPGCFYERDAKRNIYGIPPKLLAVDA